MQGQWVTLIRLGVLPIKNFSFLPTHPSVEICKEGINVVALLNTGRNKPVDPGRYISITGDPLNIKCKISCDGESPKRKMFYQGDFLVSSNIRHECLLGWDFIANNGLTLRAAEDNGRLSYFVQGRHGISPISRSRQVSDHTCQG